MKYILIICIIFSIPASAQTGKPKLDTLQNRQVIFTDETGVKYEVFRSANGYSSIIKEGKLVKLFRREKAFKTGASEFVKNN